MAQAPSQRPIRVAVLCRATLFQQRLDQIVRMAPGMSSWQPDAAEPPDVALYAAESGAGLQMALRPPLSDSEVRAAVLDLAGLLGPQIAGIYRFLGYLPPDVSEERLVLCLRRVFTGVPDAPRPHYAVLLRALESPPVTADDHQLLRLVARGQSHLQIQRELKISPRTLDRRIAQLREQFDAADSHHLAAIAVAQSLAWPYEEPPDGLLPIVAEVRARPTSRKKARSRQ